MESSQDKPLETIFIILAMALTVGIIIILSLRATKRRRQEWMALSLELDLNYQPADHGFDWRFGAFKLFDQGRSRKATNVLSGTQRGVEIVMADYQYTIGGGKNSITHYQTVCILRSEKLNLPHCFLRRQMKVFDFLGKLFGGRDIDFAEDPEFSKAFVLQGRDETATRALFDARVRQHFLQFRDSNIQFEAQGNTLLLHHGRSIKPQEARWLLENAFSCLSLFERRR